jgi:hypothetical protein
VHDDGGGAALYVGGTFASAGGTIADRIARWNGTSWAALPGGAPPGTTGAVLDLVSFDDGGGPALFALIGSSDALHRWRAGAWTTIGATSGTPTSLSVVDLGGGPVLHVASNLGSGASAATAIGTWDGTTWRPSAGEAVGATWDLAAHDDGSGMRLVAAGTLTRGLDQPPVPTRWIDLDGVGAWDGTRWSSLGGGPNALSNEVATLAVADLGDGPVLFAGGFRGVGGEAVELVAGWDGVRWSIPPASGFAPDLSGVRALCAYDAGSGPALFVGGSFSAGAGPPTAVLSWDGVSWSTPGGGLIGTTRALATFDDGSGDALFASGSFSMVGAQPAATVARWDGTTWSGVGRGVNGLVSAFAVHDAGGGAELYAAGAFTKAGEVNANNVARWNGTRWASVAGGVDEPVQALAVYDDGNGARLYAGASNFDPTGSPVLAFDGASWVPVGGGFFGRVWALTTFDDGTGEALYAGGTLATFDNIMRWDGASWTTPGGGVERWPVALATYDDGSGEALFVGGAFELVPDSGDAYLAKWGCAGSAARSFCVGDAAVCPCANAGGVGAGCADPQAADGVRLGVLARTTGPNAATLRGTGFAAAGAPAALLLRSPGLAAGGPTAFGDGLLCLSATSLVRLSSATASGGTALFTIGHGPQAGAGAFWYQLWFRSLPSTFCDPLAAFNLSSGVRIDW